MYEICDAETGIIFFNICHVEYLTCIKNGDILIPKILKYIIREIILK